MKFKELSKSQRLALLYQICEEDYNIEFENWSNKDLKMLIKTIKEILKLRKIKVKKEGGNNEDKDF